MTKKICLIAMSIIFVVAICAGFVVAMITATSGSPTVQYDPSKITTATEAGVDLPLQDLNGTWTADSGYGSTMIATVENSTIEIVMNNEGMEIAYWVGTFVSSAGSGEIVVSDKVDVPKAVMSQADSKQFVVGDGTITFELKAMGMIRSVELTHA